MFLLGKSGECLSECINVVPPGSWSPALTPASSRSHGTLQDLRKIKHKEEFLSIIIISSIDPVDCQSLPLVSIIEDDIMISLVHILSLQSIRMEVTVGLDEYHNLVRAEVLVRVV